MNKETKNENLKLKIEKIENKQLKLQKEIETLNEDIKQLKAELSKTQPRHNKFSGYIQRLRKNMGLPMFIGLIFLCVAILASIYPLVILDSKLETLILSIGFIIFSITIIFKEKKYAPISISMIVALALFVLSTYLVQSEEVKRYHTTFVLAIIAFGLAVQTFYSGEYVEKKLSDIEDKVSKLGNNALTKAESEEKNKGTGGNR